MIFILKKKKKKKKKRINTFLKIIQIKYKYWNGSYFDNENNKKIYYNFHFNKFIVNIEKIVFFF